MFRPTRAVIDLQKIKANTQFLHGLVGSGFFCPMVKANAYGHGDVAVAKAALSAGAERVGVVLVEEGLHLRKHGITSDEILVFSRLTPESALAVIEFRLTPVLSSWRDLEILTQVVRAPLAVHIKLDTGMHRMGFPLEDVDRLRKFFAREPRLKCVGLCTHLSHGDDAADKDGRSHQQFAAFRHTFESFGQANLNRHVLNSSGMLTFAPKFPKEAEWLGGRPGLALYGLCDSPNVHPAMTVKTAVDLVRRIKKGESVSYGGRWTASKDSWIGVVPIGYGDGYFRAFTNKSQMLFRGRRVPVVGTICMDYSLLDLTDIGAEPKLGEEIVVFGEQAGATITVSELTDLVGTIPYELVTAISTRVPREYK